MSEEMERLLNQPKEFRIGDKILTVEALPPGAVTMIILQILQKIKTVDLDLLKGTVEGGKVESIYALFEKRLMEADARDCQIFQLMLAPAEAWRRTKGNFKKADFPITLEEIQWGVPELVLSEILDEWLARNPRFAIQKKMVGLASMQRE